MEQRRRGPVPGSPAARRGGQAMRERYGASFFARIGAQGGNAVKARYGRDFYRQIGRKGGTATKARGGPAFFAKIGHQGAKSRQVARQQGVSRPQDGEGEA